MRKPVVLLLGVIAGLAFSGLASAVPPGKKVEYKGGGAGEVVFDGETHKQFECADCHPPLFKMKKSTMTMKDMYAGNYCGACHNGASAFSTKEAATCARCHKR